MYEFLYLDKDGIASLYAQMEDDTRTGGSRETERTGEIEGKVTASFGLGSVLKALHLADVSASWEGKANRSKKKTEKSDLTVTVENQAAYVWKFLARQKSLYKDPYEAWNAALASRHGSFCELSGLFVPKGIDGDFEEWLAASNEAGYLMFEMATDRSVYMGMSIDKILRNGKEKIHPASHLGTRLRNARHLHFTVWGRMDNAKYVKPYMVAY